MLVRYDKGIAKLLKIEVRRTHGSDSPTSFFLQAHFADNTTITSTTTDEATCMTALNLITVDLESGRKVTDIRKYFFEK